MAITKTYVLLEHTDSTANVYLQANDHQKVRLKSRPLDHAFMQTTFTDRDGNYRTIRLKTQAKSIFQDEQIKAGILANVPYSQIEKDAVAFHGGVLTTNNAVVQEFLEASPQFEGFWKPDVEGRVGSSTEVTRPLYKLLDQVSDIKTENQLMRTRVKAANKIFAIEDLKEAQALMIRLNGSFFKAPDDILDCQNALVEFLDEANEAAINDLLRDDVTVDEEATVLIGLAVGANLLSFDAIPNQVAKINNGVPVAVKEISSELPLEERKRYFSEWLTSNAGKLLLADLKGALSEDGDDSDVAVATKTKTKSSTQKL